ncbi:MAG TPA: MBL fold metallo-hydrolase [Clostridia bacterium]|nr:MBL fold metallo-hydrolase [Clostridia bacterium]
MELTFCGGAGEVGASCLLLNIDGKNLLLDSGIRMGDAKDSLPDFRIIQEKGGLDAILISHAHLDHTGSLPIISREYPNSVIYMTHATKDLVRVLLYDSLKIMGYSEGEIPIYAESHVQDMLNRIRCFSPEYTIDLFEDSKVRATFYHAGHIAGAGSIYIQGEEGSFFYSGDFSMANQHTVGGAAIPTLRPDVAVFESTYGDKLHANRQIEEERLVATVQKVIERQGKILIPAFALGRAQEVILILKRAMNRGRLPKFNVYVDGMVREICRMYRLNPNYLRPSLAKRVWRDGEIFFDDWIQSVDDREMRDKIVSSDEPCCIISSSGMLTGGPSQWYAEKIISDSKNFIAITGYQDEEAPGRQLLNLLDDTPEDAFLSIGDRKLPIKCELGKYNLSAHADRGEIIGLAHNISPKEIFLVHGEGQAMGELGRHMQGDVRGRVYIAANGESYDINIGKARRQRRFASIPTLGKEGLPQGDDFITLWEHIIDNRGDRSSYTSEELIRIWADKSSSEEDTRDVMNAISQSLYFEQDYRRPFLFRPVSQDSINEQLQEMEGPMEVNQMLGLVDEYFPPQTGLYRRGARFDEKIVLLYFKFPLIAQREFKDKFQEFESITGWKVQINEEYNLEAAEDLLHTLMPTQIDWSGKLSYYRLEGVFKTAIEGDIDLGKVCEDFEARTGLPLIIEDGKGSLPLEPVSATHGQMEQNKAFQIIDEAFAGKPVRVYKKGLKRDGDTPYIELAFITPEIGEKWQHLIEELETQTWWNIRINPSPNQNEVLRLARRLLEGEGLLLRRNPSFIQIDQAVRVTPAEPWDPEVLEEIKDVFAGETGYTLVVSK